MWHDKLMLVRNLMGGTSCDMNSFSPLPLPLMMLSFYFVSYVSLATDQNWVELGEQNTRAPAWEYWGAWWTNVV